MKPSATTPDSANVLRSRFDAVGVANNHSGDFGPDALLETLQHVHAVGVQTFGGGRNATEAHQPHWIVRNGLRIAWGAPLERGRKEARVALQPRARAPRSAARRQS